MMDIETTGLDLIKSRPIQFAFEIYQKKSHVIGSGYNLIAECMFYIKQGKPLPAKIIELTGITDEILDRVSEETDMEKKVVEILEMLNRGELTVAGAALRMGRILPKT